MSKSLGNFTSLTDLLAPHDPRAYRLLVLQSHYRAPVEVTPSSLEHASATLRGLDDFVRRTADLPAGAAPDEAALAAFRAAMDDDLVDAGRRGPAVRPPPPGQRPPRRR